MARLTKPKKVSRESVDPTGQDETVLRQARRAEIEREIVRIATEAFARRGYASPTLRDITREAGVSLPVVYWFFADKRHLYVECCKRLLTEEVEGMAEAVRLHEDSPTILVAFAQSIVKNHAERYASRLFHRVMLDDDYPLLAEIKEILLASSFFNKVICAINEVSPKDNAELRLFSLVAFTAGFMEHMRFWGQSGGSVVDPANSLDITRHILASNIPSVDWDAVVADHFAGKA